MSFFFFFSVHGESSLNDDDGKKKDSGDDDKRKKWKKKRDSLSSVNTYLYGFFFVNICWIFFESMRGKRWKCVCQSKR